MPTGPNGEKRPRDVVSAAVMVGKIATKQIKDQKKDTASKKRKGAKSRKGK